MNAVKIPRISYIISKLLPGLSGNAYTCAVIEPLWAVFYGIIMFYMPLYMQSLGVTVLDMGFINSLGAVFATITSIIAGPVTDYLGRKKTSLYFDILSWTCAMAVWAVSRNLWFFVIAAIFNSFSKIPITSWTCLAIEDTPPSDRSVFFSAITIIGLAPGIFTPITGMLIDRFGTIAPMRLLLAFGCISMTTMFFIRNHNVTETSIGKQLMKLHSSISLKDKWMDYVNAMKFMVTTPITTIALIIVLLTNFQLAFQFFLVLYLKGTIGLSASVTSLIPGISALVNLVIYFVFLPKLMKKHETINLTTGLILSLIGYGLFLMVTKGRLGLILLLISTILTASGNLLTLTFRDTLWNNVIGDGERAKIFSAGQGLISIIAIPAGIIASFLFKTSPILPFLTSFLIFLISLLFSLYALKIKNDSGK